MSRFAPALALVLLAAIPAQAQTMGTLLPTLTWPEGDITPSTKGCTEAAPAQPCTLTE
jgi:hypothetical protein